MSEIVRALYQMCAQKEGKQMSASLRRSYLPRVQSVRNRINLT